MATTVEAVVNNDNTEVVLQGQSQFSMQAWTTYLKNARTYAVLLQLRTIEHGLRLKLGLLNIGINRYYLNTVKDTQAGDEASKTYI